MQNSNISQQTYHQSQETSQTLPTISWRVLAYSVVVVLAMLFWLAEIDSRPMSGDEAQQALQSWSLKTEGVMVSSPSSVITATLQTLAYGFLGVSEFSARLSGLFAYVLLIITPALLLHSRLGQRRAWLMSLLLAVSPFVFISARTAEPMLWAMLMLMLWLGALAKHWETKDSSWLVGASVAFAFFFFLSAPSAPLLFVVVVLAGVLALQWMLFSASEELSTTSEAWLADAISWLVSWQWLRLAGITILMTLVVATTFMLNPTGLSTVTTLLEQTFSLASQSAPVSPLLVLLTYDGLIVVLALIGILVAIYRTEFDWSHRFALIWLLLGLLIMAFFGGFGAPMALWVVLPAVYLVSYLADVCLQPMSDDTYTYVGFLDRDTYWQRYWWVKWVVALSVSATVLLVSFHWQEMARNLLSLPLETNLSSALPMLAEPLFVQFRYSGIWFVIGLLFLFVGFFLAASLWGSRNVWQGYGLGIVAFSLLSSFGGAYNVTHVPHRMAEPWYNAYVASDYALLRQTLIELAQRDTSGFYEIPVTVVHDETPVNPLLQWSLRDFSQVQYTQHLSDAMRDQIIIAPADKSTPILGGSYVGQNFTLQHRWTLDQLQSLDGLAWLATRDIRRRAYPQDSVILWLRQDVFEGVPLSERP
jgi:4-amino-4-deoxy-L-arabinose transferase-like glycosyltransferase